MRVERIGQIWGEKNMRGFITSRPPMKVVSGLSDKYLYQTRAMTEIYLYRENQVGCTRMEGETRSGHLYRKPLYKGSEVGFSTNS